jgi:hypothetical protein
MKSQARLVGHAQAARPPLPTASGPSPAAEKGAHHRHHIDMTKATSPNRNSFPVPTKKSRTDCLPTI